MIRGVAKRFDVATAGGRTGQWFTDPRIARHAAKMLGIRPGLRVLDPCAGAGALTQAIVTAGATPIAIEIDPRFKARLTQIVAPARGAVIIGDFFKVARSRIGPIDAVLMNSPWETDLETQFLLHALELAPRVLGIVSGDVYHSRARALAWERMRLLAVDHVAPRPKWSAKGGGQEECELVLVEPRARPRADGERDDVKVGWFWYRPRRRA